MGVFIRTARLSKGWSQETLAERADMHDRTIRKIERGEINFSVLSLRRLMLALDMPASAIPLVSTLDNPAQASLLLH